MKKRSWLDIEVTTRDSGGWPKVEYPPMPEFTEEEEEESMEPGTHFWAKLDGRLVMAMISNSGATYVCGGREMPIWNYEVISIVSLPDGFSVNNLYYR